MEPASFYSPDYLTSRQRFRRATAAIGLALQAYPIGGSGPNKEQLTIDVAVSPGDSSSPTLMISSGIHGVEGFLGAAVQLAMLERLASAGTLPPPRFVFLHALNPFGFAWLRRANKENVDLNRNFLLDDETFRGNPEAYALLDPLLNPKKPPTACDPFIAKALVTILRCGMSSLRQAVTVGQYDFEKGLFFGGSSPSRTQKVVATHEARSAESTCSCYRIVLADSVAAKSPRGLPLCLAARTSNWKTTS